MCDNAICSQSEESSCDSSFCLQLKVQHTQSSIKKVPTPSHLITNLAYRLKPHNRRNQYLRARLDTCADVNIMPASVYRLVFKDPELKKLASSTMEMGNYTTDTVKIDRILCILFGPPGHQIITGSDILCCSNQWRCLALMHHYTCAWINATKNKTWLLTTKD